MTLGSWFRDYVYFPLGGSRKGTWTTIRNLLIVWGITGLWHGASWNFVLWGLYFGILIGIEKLGWLNVLKKLPAIFQHVYLLTIVLFGWVLFVFEDHEQGLVFGKVLFGIADQPLYDTQFLYFLSTNGLLLLLAVIASTPLLKRMNERLSRILPAYLSASISISSLGIILFLSTAYLVNDSYNPFLYFRF